MPAGAKPGERRGGRAKGVKNKGEIQKAILAERAIANAKASGRKLAVEHMQDYIGVLAGMAAYYQPTFPGMSQQNPHGDPAEFERWFGPFLDLAKALANYESPKMRDVMITAVPLREAPVAPTIDGNVISINDPVALSRVYRRMIQAPKKVG